MVRKFDRISIEFSIEFFGRKFYRIFLAGNCCKFTVVTLRAQLTRDVLAIAKFLVDPGSGSA